MQAYAGVCRRMPGGSVRFGGPMRLSLRRSFVRSTDSGRRYQRLFRPTWDHLILFRVGVCSDWANRAVGEQLGPEVQFKPDPGASARYSLVGSSLPKSLPLDLDGPSPLDVT